jgi:hypothetical protein
MQKMNLNPKTANILFVVLIIVVFAFIIFTASYLIKNKEAFTRNPLIYGAKKMDLGECSCMCYKIDNSQPLSLNFNSTSLSYGNPIIQGGFK